MGHRSEALNEARQFAETAYSAAAADIVKDSEEKLAEVRAQLAARGLAQSGAMTKMSAQVIGKRIKDLLQLRLDAVLEGYELYGISLDGHLATNTIDEIVALHHKMLEDTKRSVQAVNPGPLEPNIFYDLVRTESGFSQAWVKVQVERRRLAKRQAAVVGAPVDAPIEFATLPSRAALLENIPVAVRDHSPVSLLFIDLDNFKSVNDRFGHLAGDECLKDTVSAMNEIVRGKGTLFRYGGDEFCVVLANYSIEEARMSAERIRAAVEAQPPIGGVVRITASIGVASSNIDGLEDPLILIKAADEAMYISKATKNRVTLCTERGKDISPESQNRLRSRPAIRWQNSGNTFWLGHDLMYSMQVALHGAPKDEIVRALKQSYYHLKSLGLEGDHIGHFLRDLLSAAESAAPVWDSTFRQRLAAKIDAVIQQLGALSANNQPDFEVGVHHSHGFGDHHTPDAQRAEDERSSKEPTGVSLSSAPLGIKEGQVASSENGALSEGEEDYPYDVFVSHATEDKAYVTPLSEALKAAGIRVWLDRISLKWGDDLRSGIGRGLTNCRYGIVVFSKVFLRKKKWTEYELNSLFALEQPSRKIILPIWHGITRDDLLQYGPGFADRLAKMSSTDSYENIVESLLGLLGRDSFGQRNAGADLVSHQAPLAMPKANAIAYAWYETTGPNAATVKAFIRPSTQQDGWFTFESSLGDEEHGSKEEIAIRFATFDKSLMLKKYIRMQHASADPAFTLP
jgi:diguanylate cyclase (GGDEF)-like protein